VPVKPGLSFVSACLLIVLHLCSSVKAEGSDQDTASKNDTLTAAFSQPIELEGIIVRASRIPLTVLRIPAAATVVELDSRTRSSVTTSGELLSAVTGLRAYPAGNRWGQTNVDVRGFVGGGQAEYLRVTYDGIPVNRMASGLVNWAVLDPAELGRIEIVTGPASAQYGDFGFGGMVALSSFWPPSDRPARFAVTFGSDNSAGLNGQWTRSFAKGRAGLSLSGRRSDGFRRHSRFEAQKATLKFERSLGAAGRLSGLAAYAHSEEELPGAITADQLAVDRTDVARDFAGVPLSDESDYRDVIAGLTADFSLGDDYELRVQTYLTSSDGDKTMTLTAPVEAAPELLTIGTETSLGLTRRLLGRSLQLVTGWAYEYGRLAAKWSTADEASGPTFVISSGTGKRAAAAWYVHSLYHPVEWVSLSLGSRVDYIRSEFESGEGVVFRDAPDDRIEHTSISPKVAVGFDLAPTAAVFASVSGAFKSPTLLHLYDSPPYLRPSEFGGGYAIISNSSLEPQKGVCYELGVKLIDVATRASVTAYLFDIRNEIDFDYTSNAYDNIGRSRHQGVLLSLVRELSALISIEASLAVNAAVFRGGENDGHQINGVPRYRYLFGFTSEPLADGFVTLRAEGQSEQYLDEANERELDDFITVTLTTGYQWRSFDIGARVDNLFDREYSHDGYVGLIGESRFYPAMPRSVMVTLSAML